MTSGLMSSLRAVLLVNAKSRHLIKYQVSIVLVIERVGDRGLVRARPKDLFNLARCVDLDQR